MRALVITRKITRRDEQSLNRYLNEISKYDVLTPEQEIKLFQRFKQGDEQAYEKIISHNLRFVVSVAKQYQTLGLWLGDLINEGNIGLMKAARRFDATRGFKFISYAVWWIRQSILHSLQEKSRNIRVPLNLIGNISKVNTATIKILQQEERMPTPEELAAKTGLSLKVVHKCITNYKRSQSLDAPIKEDSSASMVSLMPNQNTPAPDQAIIRESLQSEVRQLLDTLPDRQSIVLAMFYGINHKNAHTLGDIGERLGISRERVRQLKNRGLRQLRRKTEAKKLTFSLN